MVTLFFGAPQGAYVLVHGIFGQYRGEGGSGCAKFFDDIFSFIYHSDNLSRGYAKKSGLLIFYSPLKGSFFLL